MSALAMWLVDKDLHRIARLDRPLSEIILQESPHFGFEIAISRPNSYAG